MNPARFGLKGGSNGVLKRVDQDQPPLWVR